MRRIAYGLRAAAGHIGRRPGREPPGDRGYQAPLGGSEAGPDRLSRPPHQEKERTRHRIAGMGEPSPFLRAAFTRQ
ncbi:hypothetical protein SCOCK_730014 [Actinacidiphila cocklensis]|uniref:Uncharacterized protein n=1 Tax=Actinacidiphila cocklensis TaxID=887465 RepID=A0A9W4E0E8_9ACTN|nr:hypothetical protein SCOCK_730014 [Actinacidiphila cocklensis]